MAKICSGEWMNQLKDEWNAEPEVSNALAEIGFNSVIACGFKGDEKPSGVFIVENGICTRAGDYDGEAVDWDMRGTQENWEKWIKKPLTMTTMGLAVTTGKLKFATGDFKAMIKNPKMAGPFVKSFGLMSKIGGE
ncbi:MAG: Unknown protein [uncultured Sulfurovum sp.]|uniref:SCP-2 sterol transfer family protein n=1 Tax=uncultured Sulfurovum sp. TaxID=269237 RepID=A0A6S6SZM6_9BACT|nr:MAG: Unknown protein [uncultured Sulfurovum sp.]